MRNVRKADTAAQANLQSNISIRYSILFLTANNDSVAISNSQIINTANYTANFRIKDIETDYFLQIEKLYNISLNIHNFVKKIIVEDTCL